MGMHGGSVENRLEAMGDGLEVSGRQEKASFWEGALTIPPVILLLPIILLYMG
jgi:hypothetical protein